MKHVLEKKSYDALYEAPLIAWVAFLAFVYEDGMEVERWVKDNRMHGTTFGEAMEWAKSRGLAELNGDTWKATKKGRDESISYFTRGTEEETDALEASLRKFDGKDRHASGSKWRYPISNLVREIADELERKGWNDSKKENSLTDKEIDSITTFIDNYERSRINSPSWAARFVGKVGELCHAGEYTLYRGVCFQNASEVSDDEELTTGTSNVQSWTKSVNIATQHALGNTNPMQIKLDKHRFEGAKGVVFKATFPAEKVALDFDYISRTEGDLADAVQFPVEKEVLVKCGKNFKCKAHKVL